MMLMSPRTVAAMWLLSFCLMAALIGLTSDSSVTRLLLLQRDHSETSGQVTGLHPDNHGVVDVRYIVAGAVYRGTFSPYLQGHQIATGELVRVYYRPHDPRIAVIAPPGEMIKGELPFWFGASLLGSAGIVAGLLWLGWFFRRPKAQRPLPT